MTQSNRNKDINELIDRGYTYEQAVSMVDRAPIKVQSRPDRYDYNDAYMSGAYD